MPKGLGYGQKGVSRGAKIKTGTKSRRPRISTGRRKATKSPMRKGRKY